MNLPGLLFHTQFWPPVLRPLNMSTESPNTDRAASRVNRTTARGGCTWRRESRPFGHRRPE